ncbi:MAG: hypothetical protein E7213_03270 [Clostridium sp.]|nr:hypothetical protein [Clostridium sp.]
MNKKILIGIIAVLVVAGASIYAVNSNTKNNNTSCETSCETSNDNSSDSNSSNADATTNSDSNSNVTATTNDDTAKTMEELDAAANAEIASDKDKAVKKLLDYYLGIDNTFTPNVIKVNLITNSDNTITINKTDEDSNVFYAGTSEFSNSLSDGLIITIEGYNEADKVYSYSIKNLSDIKSGNTSNVQDSGSIPENGAVTSNSKNK